MKSTEYKTLRAALVEAIESGKRWHEADHVPLDVRAALVTAWQADASDIDVTEAYLGGEDADDICTLIDFATGKVRDYAPKAMLNCIWLGMSWIVDREIDAARQELRAVIFANGLASEIALDYC